MRLTHLASTCWFVACIAVIFVDTLRQRNFNWPAIASLSPWYVIGIFMLLNLYLFALFRGVRGAHQIEVEHPLTNTQYYMGLYVTAPLLGGLAGVLGMAGVSSFREFISGVALGTLGTTFSVWVVVDPITGLIEMLLPASRKHRAERLARMEAERHERQERRERLLAGAFAREAQERERWQQQLRPQAERLAALLTDDTAGSADAKQEAVDIGAQAWRLGGLNCMRQLRDMAIAIGQKQGDATGPIDYISYWWDGIGNWRRPSFG